MNEKNTNNDNKKFLKGTLILAVSNIVVKVIGSLNWIILSRVLGGEGIGLYQMGFPIYLMAITVSSAGIPVAISIITAEKLAKKDYKGAKRVFNISLRLLFVSGIIFSAALLFGAEWLTENHWIRDSRAYYSIIALAPAVFFVTFLASFRGYLQGWQIMTPTAVSEIVEQLTRVITMLFFAHLFMPYGLAYAAGGASMGAGVGAFCALLVLMWFYSRMKKQFKQEIDAAEECHEPESALNIIKRLFKLALPVSLSSLMLPIVANLDMLIVPQRLELAGFTVGQSTELFGYLTGMAIPLINLATIFTASMTISIVPAISESRALKDFTGISNKMRTAFRTALIITFPCSAGLYLLADKVATLIYNAPEATTVIQSLSFGILLLGLHQISTGILQGLGKTALPVFAMIIAAIVKIFASWHLISLPEYGILGATIATLADFGLAALINMIFIYKHTNYMLKLDEILKPAFATATMSAAIWLVLNQIDLSGTLSILLSMTVAVPSYGITLLACGGLTKTDLMDLPFLGSRILAICQKFGYLK